MLFRHIFCCYMYFPNELLQRGCGCGLHILPTLLCRALDETLQHFLLHCKSLQSTRQLFIDELKALVGGINEEELQALILDPSMVDTLGVMTIGDMMGCLYSLSRSLCYALHVRCSTLLACV